MPLVAPPSLAACSHIASTAAGGQAGTEASATSPLTNPPALLYANGPGRQAPRFSSSIPTDNSAAASRDASAFTNLSCWILLYARLLFRACLSVQIEQDQREVFSKPSPERGIANIVGYVRNQQATGSLDCLLNEARL